MDTHINSKFPRLRPGRPPKKSHSDSKETETDFFDIETEGDDSPFMDDELSTLDEFETLSRGMLKTENTSLPRLDSSEKPHPNVVVPRRKKVARRRQIDPATCERDYSRDEIEFMNALNEYKRNSGRMFPTCSEILEVLINLGYEKKDNP